MFTNFPHLFRCGGFFEAFQTAVAFSHTEIVDRKNVGALQAVDEKHLYRPATNTAQ